MPLRGDRRDAGSAEDDDDNDDDEEEDDDDDAKASATAVAAVAVDDERVTRIEGGAEPPLLPTSTREGDVGAAEAASAP